DETMARIDESAEIADRAFQKFREMQTAHKMDANHFVKAKKEVRRRLKELARISHQQKGVRLHPSV
ncbi:MAG TPA: hypothetical protein VHP35_12990, partial [Terriglobia bacterium]|nr:hypothetical protein [Terriglobia bacterium]